MLRYLAQHPESDPELVTYVLGDPAVSYELFSWRRPLLTVAPRVHHPPSSSSAFERFWPKRRRMG